VDAPASASVKLWTIVLAGVLLLLSIDSSTVLVSGEGRARAAGSLEVDSDGHVAHIDIRGSEHRKFENLEYQTLELKASGSAHLELEGHVKTLVMVVSGASTIDARALKAEVVTIEATGNADIHVSADREVLIDASGSVNIHVHGEGQVIRRRVTGNVSIHRTTSKQ
jgi:hypothetical protein